MLLFIDTETTGKWDFKRPLDDPLQPHLVQLAAILCTPDGTQRRYINTIIKPDGYAIPEAATNIHRITTEYALTFGEPLPIVVGKLLEMADDANELQQGIVIAHNVTFDINVLSAALLRSGQNPVRLATLKPFCTMTALTDRMQLAGRFSGYKWPTLDEAWSYVVPDAPSSPEGRHTAMGDALLCREIYLAGRERGWWHAAT